MNFIKDNIVVRDFINGIYFLFDDNDDIVYIGQSYDVHSRVMTHVRDGSKSFKYYNFIECDKEDNLTIELFYITQLKPKYNKVIINKVSDKFLLGMDCVIKDTDIISAELAYEYIDEYLAKEAFDIERLAKYINLNSTRIYEMKQNNPKQFQLLWNGWLEYCKNHK